MFLYVVCLGWSFLFSVIQMQRLYAAVRLKGTKIAWLGLDKHCGLAKNTCFGGNGPNSWEKNSVVLVTTKATGNVRSSP